MSDNPPPEQSLNSLGLDLDALKISDDPAKSATQDPSPPEDASKSPVVTDSKSEGDAKEDGTDAKKDSRDKKKPYVNPDRVKTGGAQRVRTRSCLPPHLVLTAHQEKPSEEELAERMVRIREQNEKIKQRRLVRTY